MSDRRNSRGADRRTTRAPGTDSRFGVPLRGIGVDGATRCRHWHAAVDVVAFQFDCCETYYPCFECHAAATDHDPGRVSPDRFDEPAVLCGVCRSTLTVDVYLDCDDRCPSCGASFNPGCREHHHLYFAV